VPALLPGDRLYVDRRAYRTARPAPGDLVVTRDPERPDRFLVKRVASAESTPSAPSSVVLVGDDPTASRDSRQFGPVPLGLLVGRVYRCYHPPDRRREL
jgi:mitochondrial inner membrane protease subunit 1